MTQRTSRIRWIFSMLLLMSATNACSTLPFIRGPYPEEGDGPLGIKMISIPGGAFTMGDDQGEPDDAPSQTIELAYTFEISAAEITQKQFRAFVRESRYRTSAEDPRSPGAKVWSEGGWKHDPEASWRTVFAGARRPVVAVTWHDAWAFAEWLNEKEHKAGRLGEGRCIRLPTEIEWERAARGPSGKDKYAGTMSEDSLCEFSNVPDRSAQQAGLKRPVFECEDGVGIETAAVASYTPNGFGVYDLSGNVYEWTADVYMAPAEHPAPSASPDSPRRRVIKGGSFSGKKLGPRAAHRDGYPPELRGGAIGFRIVKGPCLTDSAP